MKAAALKKLKTPKDLFWWAVAGAVFSCAGFLYCSADLNFYYAVDIYRFSAGAYCFAGLYEYIRTM